MKTKMSFQSSLAMDLTQYVSLKRALGRRFEHASRILLDLDRFLCKLGKLSSDLTVETFKQWCQNMASLCSNTRLDRMRIVRNFCLYRQRTDPTCFIPHPAQFPQPHPRIQPYIFLDVEVARLLNHTGAIPDSARSPWRRPAIHLALVLLYTTGLRRGELLRLTAEDYDASAQTLLIRASKFHKSRLLPLRSDVAREVAQFLKVREMLGPLSREAPLICSPYSGGRAYSGQQLTKNLRILLQLAGVKKPDGRFPRVHDFRHSFAVNALVRWYRAGVDVSAKLPLLATWLGHVSILSTYHYLHFIEPLRSLAGRRFADCYGSLVNPGSEQKGAKR